jgi:argininosuccinate synthase
VDKVVLAYSGGLDTSVAVKWIKENYGYDVIACTINIGQEKEWTSIEQRAKAAGAIKSIVVDARQDFVDYLIWPALQAGALYEGKYPLATALGRYLMSSILVETARKEGAVAIAHGCTGKGNDQVRFDVSINILGPEIKIIAPVREWDMTSRDEEIEYAREHGIELEFENKTYSTDENIWGKSIECGPLEDPWNEPPEDMYMLTRSVKDTPDEPEYVEIEFEQGIPVALNGMKMSGLDLILKLDEIAGRHGVGRIDHVENRTVGLKSREIYEAPAAVVLHLAHQELESLVLSKDQARAKQYISTLYSDMIYQGLWFTGLHRDLRAFIVSNQQNVTGTVRLKLHKATCKIAGRKSPYSLYDKVLATYEKGSTYNQANAVGFIYVHGLNARTQAEKQLKPELSGAKDPIFLPHGEHGA